LIDGTQWRATGPFVASSALFTGILEETQQFLLAFAQQHGTVEERVAAASRQLLEGGLLQRSRSSRLSIVRRIHTRLTSWAPPGWVLDELVSFAQAPDTAALKAALLLHVSRQDRLLYGIVQDVVVPMWNNGQRTIHSADIHRHLDALAVHHPEIDAWSRQTRERLGSTTLSLLRDYGLLRGKAKKMIVEPLVPDEVALHLVKLLEAEGVDEADLPTHPDWRLWLWDAERARRFLTEPVEPVYV
jgi:hypothetical protein